MPRFLIPLAAYGSERGTPVRRSIFNFQFSIFNFQFPLVLGFALSLAPLILVCGCSPPTVEAPSKPAPPVPVRLVSAKNGQATRSITLPGNVLAYQQAMLYAKVGGYVKTVAVDKGDSVNAGALLADIEVPELIADRVLHVPSSQSVVCQRS